MLEVYGVLALAVLGALGFVVFASRLSADDLPEDDGKGSRVF